MTTALFLLRRVQLGIPIRDLELLTTGTVMDMFTERQNDDCKYAVVAAQKAMDSF